MKIRKYIAYLVGILFFLSSCEEDNTKPLNSVYLYTVMGLSVQFDNYSDAAIEYQWSFGDGETSTDKHPYHTYPDAGNYNVALTVIDESGKTDNFEDVVTIYGPEIIVDGDFSDWDDVAYRADNEINAQGCVTKIKTWGDTRKKTASIYIEGTEELGSLGIIEMNINADGNHQTGWATGWWSFTGSGLELYRSADFTDGKYVGGWSGKYQQTANQSWSQAEDITTFDSYAKFSDVKPLPNGGYALEITFEKDILLGALPAGSKLGDNISFGFFFWTPGWGAMISSVPKQWDSSLSTVKIDF